MKALTKPIHGSFFTGMLFFFQWILVHIVVFTLWWIVRDDLWDAWHIVYGHPHWMMGRHWTFWLYDKLGDPWPMMVYLFASLATPAMFGIMLGKLQYFVLRQQGYRDDWWVLMTFIAPFVVGFAQSIVMALVNFATWLTLLIAAPVVLTWGITGEMITVAGGLGFGVTQWLLLRRRFRRAAWWMVATALGEALWGFRYPGLSGAMYGAIDGAIKGTLTGLTMMWLLRCFTKRVALA